MKNTVKYTRYRGENEAGSRARARQNDRCAEITRYKQESCSSEQRIEQRRHAWRPPQKRENLPSSRTKRDKGEIYVYASRGKYEITRQAPRGACAYIICTYAKILSRSACAYVIAKRRKERERDHRLFRHFCASLFVEIFAKSRAWLLCFSRCTCLGSSKVGDNEMQTGSRATDGFSAAAMAEKLRARAGLLMRRDISQIGRDK